ncbi:MAG: hypothetical protein QF464_23065, partial [Myxococcota bacterium]|nr:hypothetical protein [Myxococcota bacterium]
MSINDTPDNALPPDVAALIGALEAPAPSAEVRARVLERVRATVATPAPIGPGAAGGGIGAAAAALGVLLVVGAIMTPDRGPLIEDVVPGVALSDGEDAPSARGVRPSATPMKAKPVHRPATSPLALDPNVVAKRPPKPRPPTPRSASRTTPAPPGKRPAVGVQPKTAKKAPAVSQRRPRPAHDLSAERAILDRAREALGRRDRRDALAAVREHARRFRRGALLEERESLWSRVLLEGQNIE